MLFIWSFFILFLFLHVKVFHNQVTLLRKTRSADEKFNCTTLGTCQFVLSFYVLRGSGQPPDPDWLWMSGKGLEQLVVMCATASGSHPGFSYLSSPRSPWQRWQDVLGPIFLMEVWLEWVVHLAPLQHLLPEFCYYLDFPPRLPWAQDHPSKPAGTKWTVASGVYFSENSSNGVSKWKHLKIIFSVMHRK